MADQMMKKTDGISFGLLAEYRKRGKSIWPSGPLTMHKTDLKSLKGTKKPTIVRFGHSSYMLAWQDLKIVVDPVLSKYASPMRGFARAFSMTYDYTVEDFPQLDVVCITHDHYDHMDYKTIT